MFDGVKRQGKDRGISLRFVELTDIMKIIP